MAELKETIIQALTAQPVIETCLGPVQVTGTALGSGKNGLVFPVDFEGEAVVKFLIHDSSAGESVRYERFMREFRRLVRLPYHEGVVRLIHFEEIKFGKARVPAIFMERCSCTLADYRAEIGQFSPTDLYYLLLHLAPTLDHLHKNGIVHRDLKPENILLRGNRFVIADFGLAWFDPDIFEGLKLTEIGDRLANHMFSAPEQMTSRTLPTAASDIYALGQVAYWSVYDEVIKGPGYRLLREADPDFAVFERVIGRMVSNVPERRPQSGQDVIEEIQGKTRQLQDEKEEFEKSARISGVLNKFEETIRRSFPGRTGIFHVREKKDIERFLLNLSEECEQCQLWWIRGGPANPIGEIVRIDDDTWLIQKDSAGFEMRISDVWVARSRVKTEKCFVLLRSEAMEPFGYQEDVSDNEIAIFMDGHVIGYDERDDGYANINGEIVRVSNAVSRQRYLKPRYIFIATNYSPINDHTSEAVEKVIEHAEATGDVSENDLRLLLDMPIRHRI